MQQIKACNVVFSFEKQSYFRQKVSGSRALLYMSTTPLTLMFYHVNADTTNFSFEVCLMSLVVTKRFLEFSSQVIVFLQLRILDA